MSMKALAKNDPRGASGFESMIAPDQAPVKNVVEAR
jgi:hypothetical protein